MKFLAITLGVLLALALLAALGVALALDPVVRRVATDQTSEALGVPVEIAEADASLSGRLTLEGFCAGNPPGFQEPRSLRFDRVAMKARLGSLFGKTLEVDDLTIERPELTIEFRGTQSNVGALLERLNQRKPEEDVGPARTFRVRRLRVEGAVVRFRSDTVSEQTRRVPLPPIELSNIGTAEDAATTSELLAAVLRALTAEAVKASGDLLPADLNRALDTLPGKIQHELDRLRVP